jgi:Rho-related BTB domain-containing protein 1/2
MVMRIHFQEFKQAAEFLELPQLLMVLNNMQSREQYMNSDMNNQFKQIVRQRLETLCLEQGEL